MNSISQNTRIHKKEFYLVALHILIGLIATVIPQLVPILMVSAIVTYVVVYAKKDRNKFYVLLFISYTTGMEILYRAGGIYFLPYEFVKYLQIGFILLNIFMAGTRFNSIIGILILFLLLPSLILFPPNFYKHFIFTSLGIGALGFLIAFTGFQKIAWADFAQLLKAFLYPCISFAAYISIKTPDFSKIEFSLGATSETTGGFGSNQVATLLGAGICLLIILLDRKTYMVSRILTFGILLYFTLRGLLSFSRGGMVGMLVSVLLSYLFFKKIKQADLLKLGLISIAFTGVFILTNNITDNILLQRYQGETTATLSGAREIDLETLSSGRLNYATIELVAWYNNIIFGVGPGNMQYASYKYGLSEDDDASHTEATRLLAENGIFGLLINLILIFWPIYIIRKTTDRELKFIKSVLFIFGYATTFHASIRTGMTPLFYALASMDIKPSTMVNSLKKPVMAK